MAGRIRQDDIDLVRERANTVEVITDSGVTLKGAGGGNLKGCCPFHDEKSPSFNVNPAKGFFHCFGCGEGGDAIGYVQKFHSMSFIDAIRFLAERYGVELRTEDGSTPDAEAGARRTRLLEANKAAAVYFTGMLASEEALTGRQFLADRGFDQSAAETFGVGYAPKGWDNLANHLRGLGYSNADLLAAGLVSEGRKGGVIDRFRGRLVWPIRDLTGNTVGFGARKLYDDDEGPKYLNTPETTLYKKSQVLFGIDLARRDIAKSGQVVVVEGYTDVMACHLSGVTTAVATCGTAFGEDHVKVVRRLINDQDATRGEIVFTFDGDAAGQKAALRAFDHADKFQARTYVAVEPSGMDPCDLRMASGAQGVQDLMAAKRPLFEFVLRTTMTRFDLNLAEGRVQALTACAPIVASIRDRVLRPEYVRQLSGWLGMEIPLVSDAVNRAVRAAGSAPAARARPPVPAPATPATPPAPAPVKTAAPAFGVDPFATPEPPDDGTPPPEDDYYPADDAAEADPSITPQAAAAPAFARPAPGDRALLVEREAAKLAVQATTVCHEQLMALEGTEFQAPAYREVIRLARAALRTGQDPARDGWLAHLREATPHPVIQALIGELAVEEPMSRTGADAAYCRATFASLQDVALGRRVADLRSELQRVDDPEAQHEKFAELLAVEARRRELRALAAATA